MLIVLAVVVAWVVVNVALLGAALAADRQGVRRLSASPRMAVVRPVDRSAGAQ